MSIDDPTLQKLANNDAAAEMGRKVLSWIKAVAGPLVVAFLTWLAYDRSAAWDRIDSAIHNLNLHQTDVGRIHAAVEKDLINLQNQIDEGSDELRECQLQQQKTILMMAGLNQTLKFPFDKSWQERILQNQRDIAAIKNSTRH